MCGIAGERQGKHAEILERHRTTWNEGATTRLGDGAASIEPPGMLHLLDPEDEEAESEAIASDLQELGLLVIVNRHEHRHPPRKLPRILRHGWEGAVEALEEPRCRASPKCLYELSTLCDELLGAHFRGVGRSVTVRIEWGRTTSVRWRRPRGRHLGVRRVRGGRRHERSGRITDTWATTRCGRTRSTDKTGWVGAIRTLLASGPAHRF